MGKALANSLWSHSTRYSLRVWASEMNTTKREREEKRFTYKNKLFCSHHMNSMCCSCNVHNIRKFILIYTLFQCDKHVTQNILFNYNRCKENISSCDVMKTSNKNNLPNQFYNMKKIMKKLIFSWNSLFLLISIHRLFKGQPWKMCLFWSCRCVFTIVLEIEGLFWWILIAAFALCLCV